MDLTRTLVSFTTGRADCLSPHLVADVVSRLFSRGHTIRVTKMSHTPTLSFSCLVDGEKRIEVAQSVHDPVTAGEAWWYATLGNAAVRFNARRVAPRVPLLFRDETDHTLLSAKDLVTDWLRAFQTFQTCRSVEEFASRVSGRPLVVHATWDAPYLSEWAIVEALEVLCTHA